MKTPQRSFSCVLLALAMLLLQGCAQSYSAKPIEAWVVDAETGKPLEGVNVVAHWELRAGIKDTKPYQLQIIEDVTDKNGRFFFPAWGPEEIPEHLHWEARLENNDPGIVIFKSGYEVKGMQNNRPPAGTHGSSVRTSDWNGKTIQIRRFQGDLQKYLLNIESAQYHWMEENCNWTRLPRMVLTWQKEVQMLKEKNITSQSFYTLSIDGLSRQTECGSAREFLKTYEK
ncbi:MAG: hypothetical protein DID91_2727703692 [Candidatus Nitrotoga sp. MKT]|nr:MAG: hypothetical protein DID91_2727703692 [Candidatus Nitrotoga sp. MKT]